MTFFKPKALITGSAKLKELPAAKNNSQTQVNSVVIFSHHRDVVLALEELRNSGLTQPKITLIALQPENCGFHSGLITKCYFDEDEFSFNQIAQEFFYRLFARGQYLVLLTGNETIVQNSSKTMSRRQHQTEAWHF